MEKVDPIDPRLFAACISALNYSLRKGTDGRIPCTVFDKVILPHYFPEADETQISHHGQLIRRHPANFAHIYGDELVIDSQKMPPPNGRAPTMFEVPLEGLNGHVVARVENGHTKRPVTMSPTTLTPDERALATLLMVDEADEYPIKPKQAKQIIATAVPGIHGGITLRRFLERGYVRIEKDEVVFTKAGRQLARPWYQGREAELSAAITKSTHEVQTAPPVPPAPEPVMAATPQPAPTPEPTVVDRPAPEPLKPSAPSPTPTPVLETPQTDVGKEVGELSRRVLEDLALAEKEKTDKLNAEESLSVFTRYEISRERGQQMRSQLVSAGLLKGKFTDAKDGRARWYGAYTGPFSQIRHFKKDVDLLERVKPLTAEEACAIIGKTVKFVVPPSLIENPPLHIESLAARIIEEHRLLIRLKNDQNLSNQESLTIFKRYYKTDGGSLARVKLVARGIMVKVGNNFTISDHKLIITPGKSVSRERLHNTQMLTPEEGLRILKGLPFATHSTVPAAAELEPSVAAQPTSNVEKPQVVAEAPLVTPTLEAEPKVNHSALILRLVATAEHAQTQCDTARRKLAELVATREAILTTLAEADRAIADQEAALAAYMSDQQSARDAIAILTNC